MLFLGVWLFPVISASMWLITILYVVIRWQIDGSPHLPSMGSGQHIAYISDTGANESKPLFIAGCVVTAVFLNLSFISARWLRHTGDLAPNTSSSQKVLSGFAIVFGLFGSVGLILLSIFDTYRYPSLHNGFLVLFLAGYLISGVFLCAEYQRLGVYYREHRILRISFWVKLTFITVEAVLVIVFGATLLTDHDDVAAMFEYVIALIFTGYILSFLLDLLPSLDTKHHIPQGHKAGELIDNEGDLERASNVAVNF